METQYLRLKKDWLANIQSHELEVGLRMKFEDRMNNLHALNRTFNDLATKNDKIIKEKEVEIKKMDLELSSCLGEL